MIIVEHGNMFSNRKLEVLVNPVNCVGVMGKGLALTFKNKFPGMYNDYVKRCKTNKFKIGEPYLYRNEGVPDVINFPTKRHWREPSYITDIENGLDYLVNNIDEWGIDNIGMPTIGCGLGGLDWQVVYSLLEEKLGNLKQIFYIYSSNKPVVNKEREEAVIKVREYLENVSRR